MNSSYKDATLAEIGSAMQLSAEAFQEYKLLNLKSRAEFLRAIAKEIAIISSQLISTANRETNLDESRLQVELNRTIFQLTSYADACEEGTWLDIRIDTGDKNANPPKPDLRKLLIPLGPVVVFGASNFPFAYSTAGGDTACALAAGCTVLLKAHPAHAETSELVAGAIQKAAKNCGLPEGIFIHLHGADFEVGKALVQHPLTKAVGFTGSFDGGKALFDLANSREIPIPVFAEMGSVNPVFILPQKLDSETSALAKILAQSNTQSGGQFCTNPGILVAIANESLTLFKSLLGTEIKNTAPVKMLHQGIAKAFRQKRKKAIDEGLSIIATNETAIEEDDTIPTLAGISAKEFL
ncbi:MAG: aldehyde dehydrogenase family protein, partial [Bacteroidota bacterium]|nr:aldehyde dehydrogenase family protein [Bacteroidota bacterium]